MKRYLFLLAGLILASSALVSCLEDESKESTMQMSYLVNAAAPVYADTTDTIYSSWVLEGLGELELNGSKSLFVTRDTSLLNSQALLMANCNAKARAIFRSRVKGLTMLSLKEKIFAKRSAEMALIGVGQAIDIPFDSVTLTFYLSSPTYFNPIDTVEAVLVNPK